MRSKTIAKKPVALSGNVREGIVVLAIVLCPIVLAVLLVAGGVLAASGWQIVRGIPAAWPTQANVQLYGLLAYAAACWIAVAAAWRWSSRFGLSREVFLFRGITLPALVASVVAFVIAPYGAPLVTHWLSNLTGGRGPGVGIHDTKDAAIYVALFVVTTPVCEEILYRGLLVAWLRRAGWGNAAILLTGSLIFGANHALPLGFVWAVTMVGLGALLFALRLRYESLTPAWLAHFLFNAQPLLLLINT